MLLGGFLDNLEEFSDRASRALANKGSLGGPSTRQQVESNRQVTKSHWLMQTDSSAGAQSCGETNGQKPSGGLLMNS